MESFTPHPDLMLLQSLSRELQENLMEAIQAGNGPDLLLAEMNLDAASLAGYAEYTVDKVDRMIRQQHGDNPNAGFCSCSTGFIAGMFLEAFTMGFRYQAEKAEWTKAKAALETRQDPPAPPLADQG